MCVCVCEGEERCWCVCVCEGGGEVRVGLGMCVCVCEGGGEVRVLEMCVCVRGEER